MSENKEYQATDPKDLREQIMDCRVGKNEREWWASHEIEKLESQLTEALSLLAKERDAFGEKETKLMAQAKRMRAALKAGMIIQNCPCEVVDDPEEVCPVHVREFFEKAYKALSDEPKKAAGK